MKTINVVAAIICKDNKIMIAKRGYGEFEGMYEFPGGKVEPHESKEEALVRELKEEMNANLVVDDFFMHVHYDYPSFILEMDCFLCHLSDDHYELLEHEDCKWIIPGEEDVVWVPADQQIIEKLMKRNQTM